LKGINAVNPNKLLLSFFALSISLTGCEKRDTAADPKPEIAVTNTYLQSAAREFVPDFQAILCLAPPGMCPGHFDMTPQSLEQLRGCYTLFRFDFQSNMDEQFARFVEQRLAIRSISAPAGLCVPESYFNVCEQAAWILASRKSQNDPDVTAAVARLRDRLDRLSAQLLEKIQKADLENQPVIASIHQAEFARWLKFDVVATFSGQDQAMPAEIQSCLKMAADHNVQIVIANQQEGTELAKILADHLKGSMVVFSNFPDSADNSCTFDGLLQKNVENLLAAILP
jgi:zinc transport system substrate-binding protein